MFKAAEFREGAANELGDWCDHAFNLDHAQGDNEEFRQHEHLCRRRAYLLDEQHHPGDGFGHAGISNDRHGSGLVNRWENFAVYDAA